MAVYTYNAERTTFVPPNKLFKNLKRNAYFVVPKWGETIVSVQPATGDEAGKIIVTLTEGEIITTKELRVDVTDEDRKIYTYSVIGGTNFNYETTQMIRYKIKLYGNEGGTTGIVTYEFHAVDGVAAMSDEQVREQVRVQGFDFFQDTITLTEE